MRVESCKRFKMAKAYFHERLSQTTDYKYSVPVIKTLASPHRREFDVPERD